MLFIIISTLTVYIILDYLFLDKFSNLFLLKKS